MYVYACVCMCMLCVSVYMCMCVYGCALNLFMGGNSIQENLSPGDMNGKILILIHAYTHTYTG